MNRALLTVAVFVGLVCGLKQAGAQTKIAG